MSKTAQPLSQAPAAIYVITHDDVMRSGATSLPEMLRLAPNLQVAQITSSRYAITARGFNSSSADKLLVLVDGRSVYTPYFSGVMWDLQGVLPDDIERIEVISGPGATLWGANAVNGVINIITRRSEDTQGGALHLRAGNMEQHASLQHGGQLGENLSYRAYVDGFVRGDDRTLAGANAVDGWHKVQAGVRFDWSSGNDLVTVQGDGYRGSERSFGTADKKIGGQNLLARWSRELAGGSTLQVQAYYDHLGIRVPGVAANYVTTYDLDMQHSLSWGARQRVTWGGGYRVVSDNFPTTLSATQLAQFVPQRRTLGLANVFVQDTVSITDRLDVIAGLKLEKDPFSHVQALPSLRMSWRRTDGDLVWLAVSRAVRAPSRLDRDLVQRTPTQVLIAGGNFQPVKLIAYELGYRAQPSPKFSFSVSTYYNVYQDLRTVEPTNGALPLVFANGMEGETYGAEAWAAYSPADWWRLSAGVNWLHKDLRFKPGSFALGGVQFAGDDPDYQVSVRSSMNFAPGLALDLDLRNVGALPAPAAPSYTEMGARVAWAVSDRLELSLTGANLLHARHLETAPTASTLQLGPVGAEIGRSVFLDTRLKF
ncbi:MAG TPA: TonB-dependent receptor [Caulobacteraceae bacterium]|nr:TonB-dependent receptor [Caulobacteraceae bacterium]